MSWESKVPSLMASLPADRRQKWREGCQDWIDKQCFLALVIVQKINIIGWSLHFAPQIKVKTCISARVQWSTGPSSSNANWWLISFVFLCFCVSVSIRVSFGLILVVVVCCVVSCLFCSWRSGKWDVGILAQAQSEFVLTCNLGRYVMPVQRGFEQ